MKVLLPTKNKIKIEKWGSLIKHLGYELVTLNNLSESYEEPKEDGNTVLENALKKAKYYYEKTGIITVTTDSSLYIDGLSKEEQIGLFAGRKITRDEQGNTINEEKLSDEENYQRLKNVIEGLGGKANGYFEEGIIIYYGTGAYESKSFTMNRIFKSPGSNVRKENAPMRSFTYYQELNKYRSEMTNEEANFCEGHIFEEQKEFFKTGLYKVSNLMDFNINILIDRIVDTNNSVSNEKLKEKLQSIKESCICIGNGGSDAASLFASLVLEEKNKIICIDKYPRDILYSNLSNYRNLLAVTYGNHNYGVTCALEHARANNVNTYVLTNNSEDSGLDNIISYNTSLAEEYSFISIASTFIPMVLMLKYYLEVNDEYLNNLIRNIYMNSKNNTCTDFSQNMSAIGIMSGDNTYVASKILKSTIIEGGLGIPVVHEKDNYRHGESTLSHCYPNGTLIYLINGVPTDLDLELLSKLKTSYKDIIELHSNEVEKIVGQFDLAMQALFLCSNIAKSMGKDLSKVEYSPVVKELYKFKGKM